MERTTVTLPSAPMAAAMVAPGLIRSVRSVETEPDLVQLRL